jgi:hypothetical protein
MAWFDKRRWSHRKAKLERKALAASVEEMEARGELADDGWDEESEGGSSEERTAIIPPLLRLQSRPWPVVRVDSVKRSGVVREPVPQANDASGGMQEPARAKRLGRSTKVHLQAVRIDEAQEPITERVHSLEAPGVLTEQERVGGKAMSESQPVWQQEGAEGEEAARASFQPVNGSGLIEQGQEEVTVSCAQVSARSVVTIMLAGNPGPVVVQYVTLHPDVGFTFHLSAPVSAPTPFNYLFWPC